MPGLPGAMGAGSSITSLSPSLYFSNIQDLQPHRRIRAAPEGVRGQESLSGLEAVTVRGPALLGCRAARTCCPCPCSAPRRRLCPGPLLSKDSLSRQVGEISTIEHQELGADTVRCGSLSPGLGEATKSSPWLHGETPGSPARLSPLGLHGSLCGNGVLACHRWLQLVCCTAQHPLFEADFQKEKEKKKRGCSRQTWKGNNWRQLA